MRSIGLLLVGCCLVTLAGCGGGGGGGGTAALTGIEVSLPANANIATNTTLHLTAVAVYNTGQRVPVTPDWQTSGSIGSVDVSGLYVTPGADGIGTITATYQGVAALINVNVVTPGTLSNFAVEAPADLQTNSIAFKSKPWFYLSADAVGITGRVIVGAQSWATNPAALGSVSPGGQLTPASDGTGNITAVGPGGGVATPKQVTIVAKTVKVTGTLRDIVSLGGVGGGTIVFYNALGNLVGQTNTTANGSWNATISEAAVSVNVTAVPSAYFPYWKFGSRILDPSICTAPIPVPEEGLIIGTFYLYPTDAGPPPPPNC